MTQLNDDFTINSVPFVKKINLTQSCRNPDCNLHHTCELSDRLQHVFQKFHQVFFEADKILIERQPPIGFKSVEQIIFMTFREKAVLVSPNSVHAFFRIGEYEYDQRKEKSIEIASQYIDLSGLERKHDIADTICMTLFYISRLQKEYAQMIERKKLQEYLKTHGIDFDRFLFSKKIH